MEKDQTPPNWQGYTTKPRGNHDSSEHLQQLSILEALPYPAWIKNRRAEYLYANQAFCTLFELELHNLKGRTDRQVFPGHFHAIMVDSDARVFREKNTVELFDLELSHHGVFWVSKSPLIDKQGNASGIVGLMRKTTVSEEAVPTSLHTQALQSSNEALVIADADFNLVMINPAYSQITGFTPEEVIGQPASHIHASWLAPEFMASVQHQIDHQGYWEGETWNRRKDGQLYSEKIKLSVVYSPDGKITHYIGQFFDNTEQKQAQDRLEFLAFHDSLTGLANRTLFHDRVDQSINHSKRNGTLTAVIYLDLNEFKPLNDKFGHKFGDSVLVNAARIIREAIRKTDTVSRLGGDEFAVLLTEASTIENSVMIAQKIVNQLRQPMQLEGKTVSIGASAGIAIHPDHGTNAEALINAADKAMYAAKNLGGNGYYLYK